MLMPFVSKTSLKMLHIRQSGSDLEHYGSWAIKQASDTTIKSLSDCGNFSSATDSVATNSINEMEETPLASDLSGTVNKHRLRDEFRRFAEWVFGPQGIASLHIIAFGDFAHGGRATHNNLLLCRDSHESGSFRLLRENESKWAEIREEYRNMMEACPVEPLYES